MKMIKKIVSSIAVLISAGSICADNLAPVIINNKTPVTISLRVLYSMTSKLKAGQKIPAQFQSPPTVVIQANDSVTLAPRQFDGNNLAIVGFSDIVAKNIPARQAWADYKGQMLYFTPEMMTKENTVAGFQNSIYSDKKHKAHSSCKTPQHIVFDIRIVPKKPPFTKGFLEDPKKMWPSFVVEYKGCE
jgi:hypothetical protein